MDFALKKFKMTTIAEKIFQDIISFAIISWFVIYVWSRFRNQTMKETIEEIKGFFVTEKEEYE